MSRYSSTELADYFIKNSSTFFNDRQSDNLDEKHRKIIDSAYELIKAKEAFSEKTLETVWADRPSNSSSTE